MKHRNHDISVATSLVNSVDWNRFDDLQEIMNAIKSGILGTGLTLWLEEKGWLHPKKAEYGKIIKEDISGESWIERGSIQYSVDAAKMLKSKAYKPAAGEVEIEFYEARCLGVADWEERDLYGEKGRKRLAEFGLAFCEPDDAPYFMERFPDLRNLEWWTLIVHEPLLVNGAPYVFCVEFSQNRVPLLGARLFQGHEEVFHLRPIAVRKIVQS
ncbi:MAG: hypothetical protein WC761_03045 [Candidatus Paceibacterota bacterium]|jgi:hypothetical protein